jgi:hypothetical protein
VPNGIHEIHVFQQHLSVSDIETYTVMCLTRVEVIQSFDERRDLRLHLSTKLRVDSAARGLSKRKRVFT